MWPQATTISAIVYYSLGEYDKALEFYQKALKIRLHVLGENHPDVADSYSDIGFCLSIQGMHREALESHQKALAIRLEISKTEEDPTCDFKLFGNQCCFKWTWRI